MASPIYPLKVVLCSPSPEGAALNQGAAFIDKSGTITTGGTSQEVSAAFAARRYFIFQNHSDTDMWLDDAVAAVAGQPSIKIYANGGVYEPFVAPIGAINVICATTGKSYTCKEA